MPRRAPRFPIPLPRGAVKFLVVLNVAVAGLLGGWFVLQPETRQREVRRLVENAFEHHKRVSALDVAWDLWQLYYADSATGRIATGDNAIVYGGAPRPDSVANAPSFRVLINRGYAVGYSDALGNPVWVAYRVRDLARLERHAADGAGSRTVADDLRMHRAGVDRLARCGGDPRVISLQRHAAFGAGAGGVLDHLWIHRAGVAYPFHRQLAALLGIAGQVEIGVRLEPRAALFAAEVIGRALMVVLAAGVGDLYRHATDRVYSGWNLGDLVHGTLL